MLPPSSAMTVVVALGRRRMKLSAWAALAAATTSSRERPACRRRCSPARVPGPEPGILQHHAVAAAQGGAGHVPDVGAGDFDGAAVDIIEPHEQIDEGGLAAAGGATMAMRWPGLTSRDRPSMSGRRRDSGRRRPRSGRGRPARALRRFSASGVWSSASSSSNTRAAQARAFCSSVTTPKFR